MKRIHVVMCSALLLFCSVLSHAQQRMAASENGNSNAVSQGITDALSGAGAKDYVPLWLSGNKLGNSKIFQSPAGVGIGTTAPTAPLDVKGAVNATSFNLGGAAFAFGTLSNQNAFLGFSGNSTTTGIENTARAFS